MKQMLLLLLVMASLPAGAATTIMSTRVQDHLDEICLTANIGVRFSESELDEMETYLTNTLETIGYTVQTQAVSNGGRDNNNIWVEINVTGSNDVTLVMGHQDTVSGSTGCGDDGLSAAVLLEYAELLYGSTFSSGRGLILMWPQFEEAGSVGSEDWEAATNNGDDADKVISLETLSWRCSSAGCEDPYVDIPDSLLGNCNSGGSEGVEFDETCASGCTGEHVYITRDDNSSALAASVKPYIEATTNVVVAHAVGGCDQRAEVRRSDHQWWWDGDTSPALLISSGASSRTDCYHNVGNQDDYDCPEWDFDGGIDVAQGVLDWLVADLGVTFPAGASSAILSGATVSGGKLQ